MVGAARFGLTNDRVKELFYMNFTQIQNAGIRGLNIAKSSIYLQKLNIFCFSFCTNLSPLRFIVSHSINSHKLSKSLDKLFLRVYNIFEVIFYG